MIENKKIKNLSCNHTFSLKKKKTTPKNKNKKQRTELRAWEMPDSFKQSSISLYPNFRRIVLYLLMHRRHTSASRDILLPKIAEQMPLRQQQGTWTSDSFPPGPYIISALTGEQRTGPSQLRLLPLYCRRGGVTVQRTREVFRWEWSFKHRQIEFRLAQLITNSRFEFGLKL